MSLVDWSEVPVEYNWVTSDKGGVWAHKSMPKWVDTFSGYFSDGNAVLLNRFWYGNYLIWRPTNAIDDPLSALWLYNLEVKKGNKFNGYDRSDLIQLIHALVKELKGD